MARKRYQGLFFDKEAPHFLSLTPQTMTQFTIEDSGYRVRPHKVIFWSEYNEKPAPLIKVLMTTDELQTLLQTIKNRIEESNAS